MGTIAALALSCLFVLLAGFNVWNMLAGPGGSAARRRLWTQIHRVAGYLFIALFIILSYFMFLRIKGFTDELSPRLIVHAALALILAPLLVVKVLVARYQRTSHGLLTALGIGIFATAFTLVALNLSVHYLRTASPQPAPTKTSALIVAVVVISAGMVFAAKRKQPGSMLDDSVSSAGKPTIQTPIRDEALTLTLARIESQGQDAKTLRFLLPRGRRIAARPGQYLAFEWMIDGKPVTRSYSICSSPVQAGHVEITVKRVDNGLVSRFLNDEATVGLTVKARGPYGAFCFDEDQHRRIVLLAGGSGITPMMAMLRYVDDLCLPIDATLIYCVRSEQDVFFKDELAALQRRSSAFRRVLVLSRPSGSWDGWSGRLRREILESEIKSPSETTFFLCGPTGFMEGARALLRDMHVDNSSILQESFGGAVAGGSQPSPTGNPVEITFTRSGVAHKVSAEETLLDSAEKNGVSIPSSCRQGVCGTCATRMLSGRVRMETQDALNDELRSRGFILPCVSRPLCDISLDA